MRLSGCQCPTAAPIIRGVYAMQGVNHGRPVYRKQRDPADVDGTDAMMFFWDERDGPRWMGWWLGPQIGWNNPGWARHEDRAATVPPATGWKVPIYGPIDTTLKLSSADDI